MITIMGHVDHGKTSLLDAIRETEVAAGEAGGITQHIGAYQVHHDDHTITFLDTPGHEAFTAMRARGAKVTDIAVIVVAADDGVMPQTVEAIDHAKAAEVPVMVAVNKIDKEGADPNRVRGELAQQGLTPADWGGDTEFVDVSAKTQQNLDDLLETLVTLAEIQELKANPDTDASGLRDRVEARPGPRRRGHAARPPRPACRSATRSWPASTRGRVRAMNDYRGQRVEEATPGMPVEILGFDGVPDAGEHFRVVENEREARRVANERGIRVKQEALARQATRRVSLEDVLARAERGEKELNLVVKADVAGSLEALADEIARLPHEQVHGQHHPRRRRRHHRVRRDARRGLRRGGHRLQRAPGRQRRAGRRPGGRRDPHLLGDLQDRRGAARGDGGHARGRRGRGADRHRRGARDLQGLARRHDRRLVRDRRAPCAAARSAASCATARWSTTAGSARCAASRTTSARSTAGMECGIVLENYPDVKEGDVIEVYETKQVEQTLT